MSLNYVVLEGRFKVFPFQDIQGDSRACAGYEFLLEAKATKRNEKTLLKE